MKAKIGDDPAFPITNDIVWDRGMTLRDYFAAKAMQEFMYVYVPLKSDEPSAQAKMMTIATASYQMADCMLKAREA